MSTQAVQQGEDRFSTLRRAIQGNGAFSLISGFVLALGAKPIAAFMGLEATAVLLALGIILLIYGVDLFWATSKAEIDRRLAWTAVILDILWVAGSYLLLLAGWLPLTVAGKWTIVLLAEVVSIFAIWQTIGLRRTHR